MDLRSTQLKDTYGNLVTIGSVAGAPTTGTLQNGQGTDLTILTLGNSTATNFRLQLEDSTTNAQLIISSGDFFIDADVDGGNNRDMIFRVDGGDESMRLESNGDISFRDGSNNEAFYWDASAGSLGLGTQTPDALLHIESNGSSVIRLTDNDATVEDGSIAGKIEFENNDSSGGLNAYIAGVNEGALGNIALSFATGAGGSATERMRIDSSGNVGIGETNPATPLDVVGTTQSSDFRSSETTLAIDTATATTVLDLTGAGLNDRKAGWIFVRDNSGTRAGAFGQFMHLSDGSSQSTYLFNVQNGVSGSSLTISSNEIKFQHTVGSTRTFRITVMYMNDGN